MKEQLIKTSTRDSISTVIHVQQRGLIHKNVSMLSSAPLEGREKNEEKKALDEKNNHFGQCILRGSFILK